MPTNKFIIILNRLQNVKSWEIFVKLFDFFSPKKLIIIYNMFCKQKQLNKIFLECWLMIMMCFLTPLRNFQIDKIFQRLFINSIVKYLENWKIPNTTLYNSRYFTNQEYGLTAEGVAITFCTFYFGTQDYKNKHTHF